MIRVKSILNGDIRTKWRREYFDAGYGPFIPFGNGSFSPAYSVNFLALDPYTTPSWIIYTAIIGNRMYYDSTGVLTWAPANMLLNSATLSTQTVTGGVVANGNYILSFRGTGSVAISGGYVGNLAGTGVNDRVYLAFTSTTASLTFTVTGSVTSAQLERVTYQTTPRTYIPTTSAQIYTLRYDYDPTTVPATPRGLLIEESRTNLMTYSQTLVTAWADTNITRVSAVRSAPDGTNTALEASASSANGTIIRTAAIGSSAARVLSIWLKRVSGTGDIQYTLDNGATWTTQAITTTWTRYTFAATTANQQVGFRIVTSGDTIQIWGAQLEAGSFGTSYVPAFASTAIRPADNVSFGSAVLSIFQSVNFSTLTELTIINATAQSGGRIISLTTPNGFESPSIVNTTTTALSYAITPVIGNANIAATFSLTAKFRVGYAQSANGRNLVGNNAAVNGNANYITGVTAAFLGSRGGSANFSTGWYNSFALYPQRLPATVLKQKSAVGAPF